MSRESREQQADPEITEVRGLRVNVLNHAMRGIAAAIQIGEALPDEAPQQAEQPHTPGSDQEKAARALLEAALGEAA